MRGYFMADLQRALIGRFLKESNDIEEETWDELPFAAAEFALSRMGKPMRIVDINKIHRLLGKDMAKQNDIALGKFRNCDVRVGRWVAPSHGEVHSLMTEYCRAWGRMDAWTAHNRFEQVHPFEDGNGRVGRLLWLVKARESRWNFELSFLHQFYYDTLKHCSEE